MSMATFAINIVDGFALGGAGLSLPAMAMWRLNRAANSRHASRDVVYPLKNRFVKMLYERGLCVKATREDQVKECWHTRAYNEGWDDWCEKCGNTGIYSRYPLYRFVFLVDGVPYVWHQPTEMVDWPVELTDGETREWRGQAGGAYCSKGAVQQDVWTVWWCLLLHGYPTLPPLFKPRLSAETFKFRAARWPPEYYRRPFGVYIPFLFIHLQGEGWFGESLTWRLSWPWVKEGRGRAWAPRWLILSWDGRRLHFGCKPLRKLWQRTRDWMAGRKEEELPF